MTLRLHHLALRTGDVAALAAFYQDVFALTVLRDELPRSIWLGLGAEAVLMIEARTADEVPVAGGTPELFAFRVDAEALARVRSNARRRGCYDGETDFTVYLRDPDGRRVGASIYRFDREGR